MESVDFILPSLYTFYDDPNGWKWYAEENIKEAKRYGKPVYPFIWPRYHDSNPTLGGQLIPDAVIREEFEFMKVQGVEGMVVWDWKPATEPWAPFGWVTQIKQFITSLK